MSRLSLLRGSTLGLFAVVAILAGTAGCSLPEVLPLAGSTTSGPSPYGPWYEQHWATNSVLLAAADQPADEWGDEFEEDAAPVESLPPEERFGAAATPRDIDAAPRDIDATPGAVPSEDEPVFEMKPVSGDESVEFNNATPYQFPSSDYAPVQAPIEPSPESMGPGALEQKVVPESGGPIRY